MLPRQLRYFQHFEFENILINSLFHYLMYIFLYFCSQSIFYILLLIYVTQNFWSTYNFCHLFLDLFLTGVQLSWSFVNKYLVMKKLDNGFLRISTSKCTNKFRIHWSSLLVVTIFRLKKQKRKQNKIFKSVILFKNSPDRLREKSTKHLYTLVIFFTSAPLHLIISNFDSKIVNFNVASMTSLFPTCRVWEYF